MKKLLTLFSVMTVVAVITTLFAGCSSSNEFRVDLEKQEIVPESSLKYVPVVVGTPHQKKSYLCSVKIAIFNNNVMNYYNYESLL